MKYRYFLSLTLLLLFLLLFVNVIMKKYSWKIRQFTPVANNSKVTQVSEQEVRKIETPGRNERLLYIHMVIIPYLDYIYDSSEEAVMERLEDYKLSLRKNLAHPLVERIHLLTTNYTETVEGFKEFMQSDKLLVAQVKSVDVLRDPWEYISNNLVGKDVMFSNADIYLGKGFEKVDARKRNIMYALSRHLAPEYHKLCNRKSTAFFIGDKCATYHGSHDIFLFHLDRPLTEKFFEKLNFNTVVLGLESRLIWLFTNVLNYCVTNPCSILEIFHYHCSDLRTYDCAH